MQDHDRTSRPYDPTEDEIAAFVAALEPHTFRRRRRPPRAGRVRRGDDTAIRTRTEPVLRTGARDFLLWTWLLLEAVDERSPAFAVLHDGWRERWFAPRPDEDHATFLERVGTEAAAGLAAWAFVSVPGMATVDEEHGDPVLPFDPWDLADVARAEREGLLQPTVNWYAESIEPHEEEVAFGCVVEGDDGPELIRSTSGGASPEFVALLDERRARG